MSIEAEIYAEFLNEDLVWEPAHLADTGEPVEFDPGTRNDVLFDVLGGIYGGNRCNAAPIGSGRGLPPDTSPSIRRAAEELLEGEGEAPVNGYLRCDAISAGWVSLEELVRFDWEQTIEVQQRVPRDLAARVGKAGGGWVAWDWPPYDTDGVDITWRWPLLRWRFSESALASLGVLGPLDRVRIVFWFY